MHQVWLNNVFLYCLKTSEEQMLPCSHTYEYASQQLLL